MRAALLLVLALAAAASARSVSKGEVCSGFFLPFYRRQYNSQTSIHPTKTRCYSNVQPKLVIFSFLFFFFYNCSNFYCFTRVVFFLTFCLNSLCNVPRGNVFMYCSQTQ